MPHVPYPPRVLTEVEIAWAAGLFEGEGSAVLGITKYIDPATGKLRISGARVSVSMTDRDVVERLEALFPCTNGVYTRQKVEKPHYRTQYVWRLGKRDQVGVFLRTILPHLGSRRTSQAMDVLAYVEDPRGGNGSHHRNKTHCPQGHPYDEENTIVKAQSGGRDGFMRSCRACGRIEARERARRKAAAARAARAAEDVPGTSY